MNCLIIKFKIMKTENISVLGYNPNTSLFVSGLCCGRSHGIHGYGQHMSNSAHDSNEGGNTLAGKYQCPMKCEGDKTYDQPGNCPVCNMKLLPVGEGNHHHH